MARVGFGGSIKPPVDGTTLEYNGTIMRVPDGGITYVKTTGVALFDRYNASTKAAWRTDGLLQPFQGNQAGAAAVGNGVFIRQPGLANTATHLGGVLGATFNTNIGAAATDMAAGDVVQIVCKVAVTGFANLAAGKLAGIELGNQAPGGTMITDKTTTTNRRITVGMDSAGDIFVVTSDGTSVTATDTTANAVSGTSFVIRITFTKGTNVVVTIDGGSSTTVATTLPTRFGAWSFGSGNNSLTPVTSYDWFGGAYGITGSD